MTTKQKESLENSLINSILKEFKKEEENKSCDYQKITTLINTLVCINSQAIDKN